MEMILEIFFLIFSNANLQFAEKKLTWKTYTATKAVATTKQEKLIDKREFARAALDKKSNTFVIYVAALEALLARMIIHLSREA